MFGSRADEDASIVAEINVTPLTDIFLVLLIIFMVTTTAIVDHGASVNLPRADAGSIGARGVVVTANVVFTCWIVPNSGLREPRMPVR